MECRYCQAANPEDEHRCRRCGRRLRMNPVYAGATPVLQSGAAPVLEHEAAPIRQYEAPPIRSLRPVEAPHRAPEPSEARRRVTYQTSLFSSRELPMVVRFETLVPGAEPSPRRKEHSAPKPRRRKANPGQQALDFSRQPRPYKAAEGAIYCDAPVAVPAHRAMAAALDASVVVIALAVFAIIFRLAGGAFLFYRGTAPFFIGAAAGVVLLYRLLWCVANGDTPGQCWSRLRLVNFDGQTPTRTQRLHRMVSGLLSWMAGGIGLLWGLVDEETLTWHDHISKTFLTPVL